MRMPGKVTWGRVSVLTALLLISTSARAEDPGSSAVMSAPTPATPAAPHSWRGVYLGGGGSYSNVSVKVSSGSCYDDCYWGDYYDYDQGDGAFGWTVHAGVRVNQYIALEAGYLDPGAIRWQKNLVYMPDYKDYYNNRVEFEATVTEVSALGILPFDPWELYLRIGAGFWDGQSTQRLDQSFGSAVVTREIHASGTGFLVGVGVGLTVADGLQLRLDLQTVGIDGDVLNTQHDTGIDSILFEVQYRFGAH